MFYFGIYKRLNVKNSMTALMRGTHILYSYFFKFGNYSKRRIVNNYFCSDWIIDMNFF
jgi:hypothetical protein